MIYTCKPNKLAIYINSSRKTMDQIKEETGADIIVNGGLFTASFKPVCHLKSNGVVYASDQWTYFGYGWHQNQADIRMTSQYSDLDNYICCVCLVYQGKKQELSYPADMGGVRPRTLIGLYPSGQMIFIAGENHSPENLQTFCLALGLDSALMLDGGGSSQGIFPDKAFRQTRIVPNFILAWLDKGGGGETCPYPEPTEEVGQPKPDWVKWIQWHLNKHGEKLEIDGIFGPLTTAAAIRFMKKFPNITPDGFVGRLTRAKLKEYEPPGSTVPVILKPNYAWNGSLVRRSRTDFIVLHHIGVEGYFTPMQIHSAHLGNGWAGIGYNYYVRKDGTIYEGRPMECIGAHTVNYNNRSVGVCFEGNFETETPTTAQIAAGKQLVRYLKTYYPAAVIKRHKDLAATACPGKNFPFDDFKEM